MREGMNYTPPARDAPAEPYELDKLLAEARDCPAGFIGAQRLLQAVKVDGARRQAEYETYRAYYRELKPHRSKASIKADERPVGPQDPVHRLMIYVERYGLEALVPEERRAEFRRALSEARLAEESSGKPHT